MTVGYIRNVGLKSCLYFHAGVSLMQNYFGSPNFEVTNHFVLVRRKFFDEFNSETKVPGPHEHDT